MEGNYQYCLSINAENLLTSCIITKLVRKILSFVDAFCVCLFKSLDILTCQRVQVCVALQAKLMLSRLCSLNFSKLYCEICSQVRNRTIDTFNKIVHFMKFDITF